MSKNTSISLGDYFDDFIHLKISEGRYKNVSEVIRAGLRLLEEEENRIGLLRKASKSDDNKPVSENELEKILKNKNASTNKNHSV